MGRYSILKLLHLWGLQGTLPTVLCIRISHRDYFVFVSEIKSRLLSTSKLYTTRISFQRYFIFNLILEETNQLAKKFFYVDDLIVVCLHKSKNTIEDVLNADRNNIN